MRIFKMLIVFIILQNLANVDGWKVELGIGMWLLFFLAFILALCQDLREAFKNYDTEVLDG